MKNFKILLLLISVSCGNSAFAQTTQSESSKVCLDTLSGQWQNVAQDKFSSESSKITHLKIDQNRLEKLIQLTDGFGAYYEVSSIYQTSLDREQLSLKTDEILSITRDIRPFLKPTGNLVESVRLESHIKSELNLSFNPQNCNLLLQDENGENSEYSRVP